jgi:hypothetical protein
MEVPSFKWYIFRVSSSNSDLVSNAAMVYVAANIRNRIEVVKREHWPAARNHRTDHLSQKGTRRSLLKLDSLVVPLLDGFGNVLNMWEVVVDQPRLFSPLLSSFLSFSLRVLTV